MDFVIIANAWSAGRDNPTSKHRIALELSRRGHRVLWIEGAGMRAPRLGSGHDRLRMVRKVWAACRGAVAAWGESAKAGGRRSGIRNQASGGGSQEPEPSSGAGSIRVLSPLFVPLPRFDIVRRLNGGVGRWSARFWCWRLKLHDPVLINYVPVLAEAMRGWQNAGGTPHPNPLPQGERDRVGARLPRGAREQAADVTAPRSGAPDGPPRVVYHCVDRWDAFDMYDSAMMAEMDRRCCRYADLVIASSRDLETHCRELNPNVRLVSHGVDYEHFARACSVTDRPPDLPPGPVIGFFGLLSEWLDQNLIAEVARRIPAAQVVLIGRADVDVSRLKGCPNIHLLGARPFSALPDYVAHFDVGVIPFAVNDLTRAVNPIKLREMLAGGCPVVSTDLPEVRDCMQRLRLESHVRCSGTASEFVEDIRRWVEQPLDRAGRAALSGRTAGESWVGKVGEILAAIGADNR